MSQHTTTSLFRRLAWQSTIPLEVRLVGESGTSDIYYMQAPRYTYLPLLIPEIRENLVEIALDDQAFAETDERDWWFAEDVDVDDSEAGGGGGEGNFAPQGPCKWHWPLDLIHLHSIISRPLLSSPTSSSSKSSITTPLRLRLHLSNPPFDKLNLPNHAEQCRTQWVNQVKEADFVRWRNTSRTTGLRKVDFDAGWDGVVNDDFDSFSRFSSRILPPPNPPSGSTIAGTASALATAGPSRPASTDPSAKDKDSAYTVRALPIKFYLPDNAPVIHEMIPPIGPDGKPQTLLSALHTHLPLLFPPRASPGAPYPLAIPILHGVEVPPEAELAWLSTCWCGADGWLRIGVRLRAG